jgi:hypothetical protein
VAVDLLPSNLTWSPLTLNQTTTGPGNEGVSLTHKSPKKGWLAIATEGAGVWTVFLGYRFQHESQLLPPIYWIDSGWANPVMLSALLLSGGGVFELPGKLAPGEYNVDLSANANDLSAWLVY